MVPNLRVSLLVRTDALRNLAFSCTAASFYGFAESLQQVHQSNLTLEAVFTPF